MRSIPVQGPVSCPRDNSELRPFRVDAVEVDTCMSCTGVWLDAGEIGRVALDAELEAIVQGRRDAAISPFPCPRCAGTCHPAHVEGVELDTCERCGGIWVDANELHDLRVRVLAARAPGGHSLVGTLRAAAERTAATRAS